MAAQAPATASTGTGAIWLCRATSEFVEPLHRVCRFAFLHRGGQVGFALVSALCALLVAGLIVPSFAGQSLAALATTTAVLPNDTYFTDLTPRQRHLVMNGRSAAVARLIGPLSVAPRLREPAFLAPVTCSDTGHANLFSVRTELTP